MSNTTQVVTVSREEYELLIRAKQIALSAAVLPLNMLTQYEANVVISPARELKLAFLALKS